MEKGGEGAALYQNDQVSYGDLVCVGRFKRLQYGNAYDSPGSHSRQCFVSPVT